MSSEIFYKKAFIKVQDCYIPLVCQGSNNAWDISWNGREVPEKNWYVLNYPYKGQILFSETAIRVIAATYRQICEESGGGIKKSRYTPFKPWEFERWILAGMKSARTIEEYTRYENRDNYVFAVITRNSGRDIKAQIYRMDENGLEKIHEEKVSGIILTDLLTLKTTIKNGEISFYAEGKALVEACYVSSITLSERMMSGIVAWGTEMTVYPPVFDGFKVHKLFQLTEKYSVRGASYGTWKANEDGTVEGSAIAGDRTDFYGKNLADIDICIQDVTSVYSDDYYVYSKITVSKYDAANEFRRVGMMAWYIDDNNFLYILYSHVGANVPDVGAIGRVGGNTVANDFTNIGGLASLLNTPVEMDVHIVGNSIEIYGGKSPLPIFKYNVPGMAAASRNAISGCE